MAPAGHFCWSLCISFGVYVLPRFSLLASQIPASILHLCPPPPSVLSTSLIRRLITGPGGWGIIRLGLYMFAHSDHSLSFCLTHISSQRLLSPSFLYSWVISLSFIAHFHGRAAKMGCLRYCLPATSGATWRPASGGIISLRYFSLFTCGTRLLFDPALCNDHQYVCRPSPSQSWSIPAFPFFYCGLQTGKNVKAQIMCWFGVGKEKTSTGGSNWSAGKESTLHVSNPHSPASQELWDICVHLPRMSSTDQ